MITESDAAGIINDRGIAPAVPYATQYLRPIMQSGMGCGQPPGPSSRGGKRWGGLSGSGQVRRREQRLSNTPEMPLLYLLR